MSHSNVLVLTDKRGHELLTSEARSSVCWYGLLVYFEAQAAGSSMPFCSCNR